MFVLIGVLFLSVSFVYADTAAEAYKYYHRGLVDEEKDNYGQAISDYTKAIKLQPNYQMAYYNRGNVYYKQGNYIQAISDFNKVIEINRGWEKPYYNRSSAYYMLKDYANAWQDVHKVESLGGEIDSQFLEKLKKASGRDK